MLRAWGNIARRLVSVGAYLGYGVEAGDHSAATGVLSNPRLVGRVCVSAAACVFCRQGGQRRNHNVGQSGTRRILELSRRRKTHGGVVVLND